MTSESDDPPGASPDAPTTGGGDVGRTLELLWDSAPRPGRGPRPGLSVDQIVDVAVRMADTQGLEAVSMRRVAGELGVGTMSLYRYVPGKAELLDLMLDRVQRPIDREAGLGDGTWRSALETLARESLALYRRHPWLLQVNQSRPVLGPGAMDGLELALAHIRPMGLPDVELVSALLLVDGYVVGAARRQIYREEAERRSGVAASDFFDSQRPALERAMASGRYPVLASLSEDAWGPDFPHFEFGLRRLLDGLELLVEEHGGGEGS
ncbi:TetR/AcrR family transcriptional regulator [Streptomyces sp. ZYX-F-203]